MSDCSTEIDDTELSELDRLLNDPEVPMEVARVWELLERASTRMAHRAE